MDKNKKTAKDIISDEIFRTFFEYAAEGVFIADKDSKIILANPAAAKILGYKSSKDLIGMHASKIIHPDDLKNLPLIKVLESADKKDVVKFERRYRKANGEYIPVRVSLRYMPESKLHNIIFDDISEEIELINKNKEAYQFLENITDVAYQTDLNGNVAYLNKAAEKAANKNLSEIIGQSFLQLFDKKDHDYLLDIYNKTLTGKSLTYEISNLTGNHYEITSIPRYDQNNTIVGTMGIARNITEKKLAQEEIAKSQQKYKQLIETASDAIYLIDIKGKIIATNKLAGKMLRRKKEDILTLNINDVDPNYPLPEFLKFWEALPFEQEVLFETTHIKSDGTIFPVEVSGSKYKIDNELYYCGVARDITERKKVEQKLIDSEAKYRALYENAPLAYQALDINGNVIDVNPKWTEILGYEKVEVVGKWFGDFIHEDYIKKFKENFPILKEKGKISDIIFLLKAKNGKEIYISLEGCMGYTPHGKMNQTYCTFKEISAQIIAEQALSKSKERFRNVLENMQLIGLMLDEEGRITFINDYLLELTGWKRNEVIGEDWFSTFLPENVRTKVHDLFTKTILSKKMPVNHINEIITKSGKLITVKWNNTVHYNSHNNPVSVTSIGEDITKQEESKKALKESEEKLRSMYENSPVGIFRSTITGDLVSANQAYLNIYGFKDYDDFLKTPAQSYYTSLDDRIDIIQQLEKHGIVKNYVTKEKRKDGSVIWIKSNYAAIKNKKGEILFIDGILEEITDKINAEKALKESEEKYKLLVEGQSDLIVKVDTNGRFNFVSPSYCKVFGKSENELLGKKFMPLVHKDDKAHTIEEMKKLYKPPYKVYIEQRAKTKKGWRWLAWQDTAVLDEHKNVVEIIGVGRDITEKKEAEIALQKQEAKINSIFRSTPVGIGVVINREIQEVNEMFTKITGLSREDVLHKNARILYPNQEEYEKVGKVKYDQIAKYGTGTVETKFKRKNGEIIDILLSSTPIDTKDLSKGVTFSALDITAAKNTERELLESETKFKSYFNNNPSAAFVYEFENNDFVIKEINDKAVEITKGKAKELINKKASALYHDLPEFIELLNKCLKTKESFTHEMEYKSRTLGNIEYMRFTFSHIPPNKILLFSDIITQQKEIELSLKESEEKYKAAYKTSPDAVNINKLDGTYVDINDGFKQLTGYTEKDVIGLKSTKLDIWAIPEDREKLVKGLKEKGYVENLESLFRCKDGTLKTALMSARIINIKGEPHILSITRDISKRKEFENELRAQKEFFESVIETTADGFWIANSIGEIIIVNKASTEMTGYTKEELLNMHVNDIDVKETPNETKERIERIIKSGHETFTARHRRKNGTEYDAEVSITFLNHEGGKLLCFIRDVTERRKYIDNLKLNELRLNSLLELSQMQDKSLDEIYRYTVEKAVELCNSKLGYIGFVNENQEDVAIYTWSKTAMKNCKIIDKPIEFKVSEAGLWAEPIRLKKPFILNNYQEKHPNKKGIPNGHVQITNFATTPHIINGKVTSIVAVANKNDDFNKSDITQLELLIDSMWKLVKKKEYDNELKDKNIFIQTILDNLPIGVALNKMNEGTATYHNKKFGEIYGWPKKDLMDIPSFFEKVYPDKDYREKLVKQIMEDINSGDTERMHWENIIVTQKNGTQKVVNAVNIPLFEQNTMVSTVIDVTEQKRAEKEIEEREKKFKSLFNQLSDSIFIHDFNGNIVEVNESACLNTGYSREELLSMNIADINEEVRNAKDPGKFAQNLPARFEGTGINKDGSTLPIEVNVSFYNYSNKKLLMAVVRDISQRKVAEIKLEELTNQLKLSLKSGDIGTWEWNIVNNKLKWDDRMFEMYGKKREQVPNNYDFWIKNLLPEDAEKANKAIADAISGIRDYNTEFRIKTSRNKIRYIRAFGITTRDKNGKAIKMTGINFDITDQKEKSEQLSETLEMYKTLIQQNQDAIFLMDKNGKYIDVNKKACELLGYTPEEYLNMTYVDVVPKDQLADSNNKIAGLKKGEDFSLYEKVFVKKDGTKIPVEISVSRINDSNNNIKYILSIVRDISERKEIEKKKKINEQRLESLFKISQFKIGDTEELLAEIIDGALKLTKSKAVSFYEYNENNGKLKLLGRSRGIENECKIENATDEYTPEDTSIWYRAIQMKKPITINNYNKQHPWLNGISKEHIPLQRLSIIPVTINNIVVGVLGIANKTKEYEDLDIEQVSLYMRSAWNVYEKQKFREEIIKAKNKAEESDRLKSAFLANMSHEIRTPMNGIVGFAQILKRKDLSEEQKEKFINIIISGSNQLLGIINDIIDISKIESGQIEVVNRPFKISALLDESVEFFKPQCKEKGIDLVIENNYPVNIVSDRMKIAQILNNLISNAIKFTLKGAITIHCVLNEKSILFSVKDTGIGIAKKDLDIIFERFRQADDSSTRKFGGTGLGLSITRAFTQALGGNVWVESQLNKGSKFYVEIPVTYEQIKESHVQEIHKTEQTFNWKNKSILVVEDEEANYIYISELLEETKATIIHAKNGKEAVKIAKENAPDCILMDIKMPVMNGYIATQEIRKFNAKVPIIAQTAYALSEDVDKSMEAGCNEHISKPIEREKLFYLINKYIDA